MVANHKDFPAPPNPHRRDETNPSLTAREIAVMVAAFVEDHCGKGISDAAVLDGMWLAMQMISGPGPAAAALRYYGVNFANK